ncbi:MAG: cupin domain-containing protein [Pseudomonadota bacterium]
MAASVVEGFDARRFVKEHWQRQPALFRNARPDFDPAIDGNDLAALACHEDAQARLVLGPDDRGRWAVEYGPFNDDRFASLPPENWTLLVQDVDKWDPAVGALLTDFRFLPDWRLDDIMVSFAVDGGSVGPHWDHYDVFLLQAAGHRRWSIDAAPAPELEARPDSELKLLRRFTPTDTWTLGPGDMLYLPPGVPHHGVAVGDCLTWSVGLRAPSAGELLVDFAESRSEALDEALRLTGDAAGDHPARIDPAVVHRARELVTAAAAADEATFTRWLGGFLTRYRLPDAADGLVESPSDTHQQVRCPWSRWAFVEDGDRANLFVNGTAYACSAAFARTVTATPIIARAALDTGDPADATTLEALLEAELLR